MSAPFQPGDVVVCVDDSPRRIQKIGEPFPIKAGTVGRVWRMRQAKSGAWGLFASGYPEPDTNIGWHSARFRKIDDEVTPGFREVLRKLPLRAPEKVA